jgi:HPt (histidine-containing phosphotransfer) domain-containing protein
MEQPLLDLSALNEVSSGDPKYVYDIICLFLDNVPAQIAKLDSLIAENADWLVIQKHSHGLKSSVLFVKIRGLYDHFYGIEMLARQQKGREEMRIRMDDILNIFREVMPLLEAEKARCGAA